MNAPCPFATAAVENATRNTERFRAKCDELIAAIEWVRDQYVTHHPDTPGSEVSRECAGHILHILPPLYDVLDRLSDEGTEYGADDTIRCTCGFMNEREDAIEAVQDFIAKTVPAWQRDEKEE